MNVTSETIVKRFDLKEIKPKSKVIAIFDDVDEKTENIWKGNPLHFMEHFLDDFVPWSEKEKFTRMFLDLHKNRK